MKLNITYNGQTISVADGKSLTLKCKDLKARGNITVSAVADVVEMQTLIVVNTNNTAETASFTMPSGYTFGQFIGSEYDTSGGKFVLTETDFVKYDGYWLLYSTESTPPSVNSVDTASGTFYYAGESATTYELSGTWVFNENPFANGFISGLWSENISFNSNSTEYFSMAHDTGWLEYGSDWVYKSESGWENEAYRTITFDVVQTVSKEFYEWFTANTVFLGGSN